MASQPQYVKLPKLFAGNLFRVPDYQRGYAWTRQQLDDLWGDIELLDGETQHFTGMIVVEHLKKKLNELEMQEYEVLEVIDGQQRLTTLVLLLQTLVEELKALPQPDAMAQATILQDRYIGKPGWFRLALNEDSRTYFEHLLATGEPLGRTENGSQRNILDAVQYLRRKVRALAEDPEKRYEQVSRLVRLLQSNLRFLSYQVDDDAEAGLIFEVMNNRGKPLSEADRLKNYLMYLAHKVEMSDDAVKGIARSWGDIFKQVMLASPDGTNSAETENRLLRNHWIIYKEASRPREFSGMSLSQRVKQEMLLTPVPAEEAKAQHLAIASTVEDYTRSLTTCAHDFSEIANPTAPGAFGWIADERLRRGTIHDILSLDRMGHTASALPLLMAGRRRLGKHPELFRKLAGALSKYSLRVYVVCDHRSHTGQSHFRRLAHDLFHVEEANVESRAQGVIDSVLGHAHGWATDEQMRNALRQPDFFQKYSYQAIRYLFFEYEIHECHGQEPALDWATFSNSKLTQVEHIFPQAGTGDGQWLGGSKEVHDANVQRLGNLTVTHFNQTLSNRPFEEKRPIYAKSNLVIENSLQHYDRWDLDTVKKREESLVSFVLKRWGV